MTLFPAVRLALALLPVLLFLLALTWLDSYRLVRMRSILVWIIAGGLAAAAAFLINALFLRRFGIDPGLYSRYDAPVIEETLKAVLMVRILRSHKAGFLVDAAIYGFAIGAGFALMENLDYLRTLHDARPVLWAIRGFGTAIMHGAATAIFAILSKSLSERRQGGGVGVYLPGAAAAIVLHSLFNHFLFSPAISTVLVFMILPLVFVLLFEASERSLQRWLGVGFDADSDLLLAIRSGRFTETRAGRYLEALRERFAGEALADMLCYLRLDAELSLRAKGELLMREAGFRTDPDADVLDKLREMRFLERSIGPTGRLALAPMMRPAGRALWERDLLAGGRLAFPARKPLS